MIEVMNKVVNEKGLKQNMFWKTRIFKKDDLVINKMGNAKTKVENDTWYVAIQHGFGVYTSFTGAGGSFYHGFKERAGKYGTEVVAERFDIDDATINRLTGFDKQGKRIHGDSPLTSLVKRLETGEKIDAQVELDKLCVGS